MLAREPDFSSIPPKINPKVPQLIRRAVEKQPKRRWQAIGDLRIELEAAMSDPYGSQPLMNARCRGRFGNLSGQGRQMANLEQRRHLPNVVAQRRRAVFRDFG